MAENGGDGSGGGGVGKNAVGAAPRAEAPARPTVILPPRSSFESLFRGGSASDASPGPLTLVSSFFAEDPDSECRSFTQLLAGAMNSPPPAGGRRTVSSAREQGKEVEKRSDCGEAETGTALVESGQNRQPSLAISQPEMFSVPPGLSPASLLDSPAFFSSALGKFAISNQEVLAQVTAQAAQSQIRMLSQAELSSSFSTSTTALPSQEPNQEIHTLKPTRMQSTEGSRSDPRSELNIISVDKLAHDGYNWRKYGQKVVKGSGYPRSYYKCTHSKCPVKKKVERLIDGQVSEIIYKGQHNHERPAKNRRTKKGNNLPSKLSETNGHLGNLETDSLGGHGNFSKPNHITAATNSRRDQVSDNGTSEQLSELSDGEEVTEIRTDEGYENERDPKRRNMAASSQRTLTEPRIIVQTTSEVDLLDDGYNWRKYGQKVVKGNPNPRSYYKCTYAGCNVRKHIERSATDYRAVITSYEGKHNHDIPNSRNSSHSTLTATAIAPAPAASSNSANSNQASLSSGSYRNSEQQSVAVLQLKEECQNT